ncbi:MAG: D-alanyl-D-alanine carboxypeptidase [Ferruginibacter sp.]
MKDTAIRSGHIGICLYEPAKGRYWYQYNADKYFVPASNTKIFTLYAGLKFLGDSIPGLKVFESETALTILPTGDPTLLHPDFKVHNVLNYLKSTEKSIAAPEYEPNLTRWGNGWAWNDYNENYMVERSPLPIYGNVVRVSGTKDMISFKPAGASVIAPKILKQSGTKKFISSVQRDFNDNTYTLEFQGVQPREIEIPFVTSPELSFRLLSDTLHKNISWNNAPSLETRQIKPFIIYSHPSDSLYKITMHRSDNFFADQILLMVSNMHLGYMNDNRIIDTILNKELADIPQKPRWVDGSGLSRYNLFTPQSFVYILNKMKNEFGFERIKNILPTGGSGTLRNFYLTQKGTLFAKTGTLSNNVALSGYLFTKNKKLLIFSILANNYQTAATPVRKAVEKFLLGIIKNY